MVYQSEAPCKGCHNRHTACHDHCDIYKQWRDKRAAVKKALKADQNVDLTLIAGIIKRREQYRK